MSLLFAAPLFVLAQQVPEAPAERARKTKETEQALAELREDVDALKVTIADAQRAESETVAAVADAERAVSDRRRAIAQIDERIGEHEAELLRIAGEQTKVEADVERQRDALAAVLRLMYARSRQAPAKSLLDPQQVPRLARTIGYGRILQRDRLSRIANFTDGLAELAKLAEAQASEMTALAAERSAGETEAAELVAALAERESALAVMRQELTGHRTRLETFARDEQAMRRLLEQLRDIFADLPDQLDGAQSFRSQRGKLPWPVDGQADEGEHGGLLIAADTGTPVAVVAHGRVAYADWLKGYGLLAIVDHGDGYMSLYGHNDALLKAEGAWVQAGEVIASVGRSGGGERAALYFELRERGRSVDPKPWLRRR